MQQEVLKIFEDSKYDDDNSEITREDALTKLSEKIGWDNVREGFFSILLDDKKSLIWNDVITSIYLLSSDNFDFPVNYTIAILYNCLEISNVPDGNLVWSITKQLKGIKYMSDYDPYNDYEVFNEMKKINRV